MASADPASLPGTTTSLGLCVTVSLAHVRAWGAGTTLAGSCILCIPLHICCPHVLRATAVQGLCDAIYLPSLSWGLPLSSWGSLPLGAGPLHMLFPVRCSESSPSRYPPFLPDGVTLCFCIRCIPLLTAEGFPKNPEEVNP